MCANPIDCQTQEQDLASQKWSVSQSLNFAQNQESIQTAKSTKA